MKKTKEKSCNIIVPTLNSPNWLRKCLSSIRQETKREYELIVVADIPNEETLKVLDDFDVEGRVINNTRVGCTRATNQGIKHKKADYYVILGDDTIVTENWLSKLTGSFVHPSIGLVSPISNISGQWIQEMICCDTEDYKAIQKLAEWVDTYHKGILVDQSPLFILCFAIPQTTIDKIGYFDEKLFMHHYDVDYCLRVVQAGLHVMVRMDTYIYHKGKVTEKKLRDFNKRWNIDTGYYNKKWNTNVAFREE